MMLSTMVLERLKVTTTLAGFTGIEKLLRSVHDELKTVQCLNYGCPDEMCIV